MLFRSKLGPAAATTATAHKIAIIFYTMVKKQIEYDATLWAERDALRQKRIEARLHKQAARPNSMNLIFPNAVGKPYESANLLKRVLHPALKALGLPKAGGRVFRRSAATALSEMREPVRTAQQVLGHASPQTTLAYYIQSVEESQRSAIRRLEERMMPPVG